MTLNTPSGVTGFVLVVDDEDDARLMTSELLAARGYAVEAVRSGFEALEFIQRTPPDLVLLDVLMEGMDGFETLRRIRALNITPYIPVVLLTALDTRHRDFGIDSGADDYITKPWSIDDLLARVKVGLRLRRLQTDLHREKERFRSVVENAFDPWAEISSDGSLTPLNHRCSEFFHIESAVSLADLISEDHAEELAAFLSDAAASGRASADLLLKDGVRTVRISAAPIASGDGNGSVLQCCIRDITTEVQQLDELNRQKELLEEQISELHDQVADRFDFSGMLSRNSRMGDIFTLIRRISDTLATVLITGETGTGKELVARSIHLNSPVAKAPFVKVDCGALSANLLESELFGHVKGAFTSAVRDKVGRFELAHGGTIFLDEIGNLPPEVQVKLLRVLQDGTYEPVGSNRTSTTNARIIAATNEQLLEAVESGRFRADLYYRLNVVSIALPPLRERRDDIPLLVEHFLDQLSERYGRTRPSLDPDALAALVGHNWPGNVRELRNVLEEAVILARNGHISSTDLRTVRAVTHSTELPSAGVSLKDARLTRERQLLVHVLRRNGWNCSDAARELKVSRTTLYKKMTRFGISAPAERQKEKGKGTER